LTGFLRTVVDELYREHALRLTWTGTLTLIGW
jgi:hypothetical protein